jgi:hypothetical protein
MIYDWQIYPMRWMSTEFDEKTNNQKVSIEVWRDGNYKRVVTIEYKAVWLYGDALIIDAFRIAQEVQFERILGDSPLVMCAEPPSVELKPCEHCGAGCDFRYRDGEPCYGEVSAVDGPDNEGEWTHACDGHADCYDDGGYKVKP